MKSSEEKSGFVVCAKTTSLQHLRRFWTKTLNVLNRLEKQWEFSAKNKEFLKNYWSLSKVRGLFNCYELIIIQFNEYCEVLQLQGLGKSMLKMFIQMMSVLESMVRSSFRCEENQNHNQNYYEHHEKKTKRLPTAKQNMLKRQTKAEIAENDSNKYYFAQKEKNKFEVRQMEQQLNKVQKKYIQNEEDSNVFIFDNHKIKLSKEKAINLEPSNAQFMITEACIVIESKYNSLLDLMDHRNQKIKMEEAKDFKKIQQSLFEEHQHFNDGKNNEAMKKLIQVVEKYYNAKQYEKAIKMKHQQTQTIKQQPIVMTMSKQEKQKQMKKDQQIKNLKQELKQEKVKTQSLERLLKEKSDNFQKQLLKQRANVLKLQQRVSIVSKFSHRQSQFALDFVTSEQSFIKQQQSQKQLRSSSKLLQKKVYDRKSSRIRPSYERIQKALDQMGGRRSSRFVNQRSIILNSYSNVYELVMHPSRKIDQNSTSVVRVTQCDIGIQTQKFRQLHKQKPKVEKMVKFKTQLKVSNQFQIQIGSFIRRQQIIIKQFQGLNNTSVPVNSYTTLLKKKKGIANWSKSRHLKTVEQMIDDDQLFVGASPKRSYSKNQPNNQLNKQNLQELFIGRKSDNFNGSDKSMFKNLNEQRIKVKAKIPDITALAFNQKDVQNLFLDSDKASDFQFLNYNLSSSFKTRHDSLDILKSQRFNNLAQSGQKNKKYNGFLTQHRPASGNKIPNTIDHTQYFVRTLHRHMNLIKNSSAQKHEKIRNFLRFPHSAIHKSSETKWIALSKQQQQIGINQLRKIFVRLQKIHGGCNKIGGLKICDHLVKFLTKLGITVNCEQFL